MKRLLTLLAVFGLISATTISADATPRKKTRTEYVVTEIHPATKGVVSTLRFTSRVEAIRQHDQRKASHWVQWRYMGINEPMRYQRFSSAAAAQSFINNDGPSRSGKLGVALLTNETKMLPAKVTFSEVEVPVTGGGNGGRNGDTDGVIDTIDRLIGIIGN